jgi:hypothetical protein
MKKLIATLALAGVLTVGAAGTAFAAGDGSGSGTNDGQTSTSQPAAKGHRGLRRQAIKISATAAAAAIGVDVSELKTAVQGGQTVAQFAQSKNVETKTVVDAIEKALNDRLDQAVADGKVTAERAAKAKGRIPQLADRLVNSVPKRFQSGQQSQAQG